MAKQEEILLLTLKLQQDSKNAKTINELTKANKALAKIIKDAPREGTEEYKKLEKQLFRAKKQYAQNAAEIKKFNKELKAGEKEAKASSDSLKGLSATLKDLEKEYKLLTKAERKASDGRALRKSIKQTRTELLKSEKGLGDFRRAVGSYTRSVVSLSGSMGALAVSVGVLRNGLVALGGGFRTASTGAKLLLASLGPIAIIIAVITAALSKFQVVIDKVQALLAGLGAGLSVLGERIGRAGLAFDKLKAFDFQGFADEAKAAFAGIGDEILNDVAVATELEETLQQIRRDRARNLVADARLEVQIADARRRSQELEKKDRLGALAAVNEAIDLTNQKYEAQIGITERSVDALRQQVNLSNETTSIQDVEGLAQAERGLILLTAQRDDAIRGLTRRKNTLSKVVTKEVNQLDELQKRQAALTREIKRQLLTSEDATKNLKEFAEITARLLDVEKRFKALTEETEKAVTLQAGSIASYNAQLSALNDKLDNVSTASKEYKILQDQILQVEAMRSVAIGNVSKQLDVLNKQQIKNIAELEDAETESRLRQSAQDRIEALGISTEEGVKKRLAIEKKLNEDIRQVRSNRVQDALDSLNEEKKDIDNELSDQLILYSDNETKRQELLLQAQNERDQLRKRELELEAELLAISVENYKDSEKQKTDAAKIEEGKRKQERELAVETSLEAVSKIVELFSILQQQQTEKQLQEINKREEAQLNEAELTGKTEAQKQEIRDKFQAEREALEKRAANERKAIALAEAAIDIASAIIKSLPNAPLAAAAAALGAIQLGVIAATNFANGGLVQPVELESGRIVNTPNIPSLRNGDNLLATVKVDEVILNKQHQAALGGPSTFASIGVPGFARGGRVDFGEIQKTSPFANSGLVPKFQSSIKAKAFANSGVAALDSAPSTNSFIASENQEFYKQISIAVAKATYLGSKEGLESADIKGKIDRENEREQRRTRNSNV